MGKAQTELARLIRQTNLPPALTTRPPAPRLADLGERANDILELYRDLGGVLEKPRLAPRGWDICLDGLIVELDEEQHFNRYRALTLTPHWAQELPWAAAYRHWSRTQEPACLRKCHGGYWTNPSSETQFGPAAPRGDLESPGGSPRGKQRALYDCIRDLHALTNAPHALARVSIYDDIRGYPLTDILTKHVPCDLSALQALIESRTITPQAR